MIRTIKRTAIILVLSLGVVLASRPLATTEWAQNMRSRSEQPTPDERNQREEQPNSGGLPAGLRYTLPFVKEFVLMGVPGLVTLCTLRVTRRRRLAASSQDDTAMD